MTEYEVNGEEAAPSTIGYRLWDSNQGQEGLEATTGGIFSNSATRLGWFSK